MEKVQMEHERVTADTGTNDEGRVFVAEHVAAAQLWKNGSDVLLLGPAGTGKTYAAATLLCEEAEPGKTTVTGNSWQQVLMLIETLRKRGGSPELLNNTGTRAAAYNTGRVNDVPDARAQAQTITQKAVRALSGKKVWNDEVLQWRPGLPQYVNDLAQLHRGSSLPMGGLQFGGSGGIEQLLPILAQREYVEARERQARPKKESTFEDGAIVNLPHLEVVNCKKGLRQRGRVARNFDDYGAGLVTDDGWQMACEMQETDIEAAERRTGLKAVHLWSWNSEARENGFKATVAEARRDGREYETHIDPIGAQMR